MAVARRDVAHTPSDPYSSDFSSKGRYGPDVDFPHYRKSLLLRPSDVHSVTFVALRDLWIDHLRSSTLGCHNAIPRF